MFIATRGDAYSGDIAIDNIKVNMGACHRWSSDVIFTFTSYYLRHNLLPCFKAVMFFLEIFLWQFVIWVI